ncbi:MAG: biosynthetic-type acetolactate synthase large subunit [Chloroflexota bacterium]
MKKSGADIVCESLLNEGVDTVFGILGAAVLPLYDAFSRYPQLRHILVRHEQAAAHAADAYARACERVGVCIATSGPGATNLVSGIATAYLDSAPMVAITGQVPSAMIGKDAFQETDITGITLPITKHNYFVSHVGDLARSLKEAFHIARTNRPGPVLVDVPIDVQKEQVEYDYPEKVDLPGYRAAPRGHTAQIRKAVRLINEAERPLIIAGHGVILSKAYDELKELAEKAQIPVVNTLLGMSSFPTTHVLHLGMMGIYGLASANLAVQGADLIVAAGMRFDDRATGDATRFAPGARIVHIDIDAAEIGKNVRADVPIVGDVKHVLRSLLREVQEGQRGPWLSDIAQWQQKDSSPAPYHGNELLPQYVIGQIDKATQGEATIVTGIGQHQMWAAHHSSFGRRNSFISSGGLGTMGFELPAAIGAKVARPDDQVWCIAGDGGFQMTLQELATVAQERLDIKVAIVNNGYLGMVRQLQELLYDKRYMHVSLWNPDFVKIADAYGIAGLRVAQRDQVPSAIARAMEHAGPFLIDFAVEPEENIYPIVPPGASLEQLVHAPHIVGLPARA